MKIQYIHLHPLTTPRLVHLFTTAWIKQDNPTSRIFEASPQVSAFAEKIELFTLGLYNLQHLQVLQIVARVVCNNVTSHFDPYKLWVTELLTVLFTNLQWDCFDADCDGNFALFGKQGSLKKACSSAFGFLERKWKPCENHGKNPRSWDVFCSTTKTSTWEQNSPGFVGLISPISRGNHNKNRTFHGSKKGVQWSHQTLSYSAMCRVRTDPMSSENVNRKWNSPPSPPCKHLRHLHKEVLLLLRLCRCRHVVWKHPCLWKTTLQKSLSVEVFLWSFVKIPSYFQQLL